VQSGAASSC